MPPGPRYQHFLMLTSCSHLYRIFSGHLVTRISIETHFISLTSCSHIYPYFNKHLVKGSLNGNWAKSKDFQFKVGHFFLREGPAEPQAGLGGCGGRMRPRCDYAPAALHRIVTLFEALSANKNAEIWLTKPNQTWPNQTQPDLA